MMSDTEAMDTVGFEKRYYLAIRTGILRDFLGWSAYQVLEWAQARFGAALDDDMELVYHVSPQYWITTLLIPPDARSTLKGLPLVHLQQALESAFWDERYPRYQFPTDMDWTLYKERVAHVLQEHLGQ